MRMTPAFRMIAIILAVSLAAIAILVFNASTKTEKAYVFVENVPQYTFISSNENLKTISVPANRDFEVITDASQIVGKYAGQTIHANQLVQQELLIDELPDGRRKFENGLLPIEVDAYPIPIPNDIASVFKPNDLVDVLVMINQDGEPSDDDVIFPLFQKITALEVIGGDGGSILVVGLNYQQIGVYEGLKNMEGVSFTAAINQSANSDYPALYPSQLYPDLTQPQIRDLFAVPTPTPTPLPETDEAANLESTEGGE